MLRSMMSVRVTSWMLLIPCIFLVTTVVGAYRWYSPVPFWDMWDGYIRFFTDVHHGLWREFFSQANEHRDVVARILFWLDIRYFGGRSLLLIPVNIALMIGLWMAIAAAAKWILSPRLWMVVSAGTAALCFSWMQSENIVSGYQGVFFSAYLFPLLAFECLAISSTQHQKWFVAALAFGFASLGTMANGVIVLPLMLVMYMMMPGATVRRIASIVILYAAGMAMWLHRYKVVPHEKASLADMANFVLVFLGAPFEHVSNNIAFGSVMGAAFLLLTIYFFVEWARNRHVRPVMVLALVMFCGYVCAAAFAAASGRASAGIGAALAGRYATPTLLGWSAMAVLIAYRFGDSKRTLIGAFVAMIGLAVVLFPVQLGSLSPAGPDSAADKMLAAMAIRLGIDDQQAVGAIYPVDTPKYRAYLRGDIKEGARLKISIFNYAPLNAIVDAIGKPDTEVFARPCYGSMDVANEISPNGKYLRASGWAFDRLASTVPDLVVFVDGSTVVGAAVVGKARPDVVPTYGDFALRSGYSGFILASADRKRLLTLCLNDWTIP